MIGDNIKRLMRENNYTQKELALRVGCTQASISSYINNKQRPGMKTLKNLAIALGVTVDELKEGGCKNGKRTRLRSIQSISENA